MGSLEMCAKLTEHLSEHSLLLQTEKLKRMALEQRLAALEEKLAQSSCKEILNPSPLKAGGSPAATKAAATPLTFQSAFTPPPPNAPIANRGYEPSQSVPKATSQRCVDAYMRTSIPAKTARARKLLFLQPPASPKSSPMTRAATCSLRISEAGGDVMPAPGSGRV